MKKNLIALAVAAGIAAPMAASADATIYGVVDMEVAQMNNGDKSGLYMMSRNTRIGFKGKEDLGMGGTSAIWQIESDMDSGTNNIGGTWAGRNTFVGLTGGWGTVVAGKHDTPYKMIGRKVELFGHHLGDFRSVAGAGDVRADNTIAYIMPSIAGVGLALAYITPDSIEGQAGTGGTGPIDKNGAGYSANLSWTNGAIYVAGAIQHQDGTWVNGQGSLGENTTNDGADQWRLAFKWAPSFGLKLTALAQEAKAKFNDGSNDEKITSYGIGAGYTFGGKHTIKGQYYQGEFDDGSSVKPKASLIALGYDFSMSKKTTLYVEYAMIDNKDGAGAALYSNTVPTAVDDDTADPVTYKDPNGFGVGLKVKF
jgi:predicted porin